MKMLVDYLEVHPERAPQSLRLVLLGGDWIPVNLPDRLRALVSDVRVISMGGATECSMDSTIFEVLEVDPAWTSIPYGEPMANQLAYVLDAGHNPLPVGVPGELYLGGIGVGRGYFERPELTAERFLDNPFVEGDEHRMYRTGDVGRRRAEGTIEFLGRSDDQAKIRGHRVEPGEVAAYDAPFPDDSYKAGARIFPTLVPTSLDDPESVPNQEAWKVLEAFERPFLCAFGDEDKITAGNDAPFRAKVPGAAGLEHRTMVGGGHFLQEDSGPALAKLAVEVTA